jgi:hypothetical protein
MSVLTDRERELLFLLWRKSFKDEAMLERQIENTESSRECGGTFIRFKNPQGEPSQRIARVRLEAVSSDLDGSDLYAILHVFADGVVSILEVFRPDGNTIQSFPCAAEWNTNPWEPTQKNH